MKTEITIDGVTYKVGDVLCRKMNVDCTIVYIGIDLVLCECHNPRLLNSTISLNDLKHWKIKKPQKKIVVERWINVYPDQIRFFEYLTKEAADAGATMDRIACEHFYKEYLTDSED